MNPKTDPENERLIVVSNRLPVRIERVDGKMSYQPSAGGLATSINALRERMEMLWLGWPGITLEEGDDAEQITSRLRGDFGCVPNFLPKASFDRFYYGFSNRTIWPLFHYFPQHAHYVLEEWEAYKEVNSMYRDLILDVAEPGDKFWIHDYQLMLLPSMIRNELSDATIGFFLHIPFPSYEIFRILPWREEILMGMLGADLIGFHTFGYARHFLSSLLRVLGLEQDFGEVLFGDRQVKIDTFPLGIDVERFMNAKDIPEVAQEVEDLKRKTEGRKVILSVDRLDFTKGVLERLQAFETYLNEHPEWLGKVTLILLCVPSRTRVPEYQQLKRRIDEWVGHVNGHFGRPGWTPIWYLYRSLSFEELVPLYLLADVAFVTPLRDGMNLVAKEYLAAHRDGSGALVLSETAGAAEELGEALIVNPHDERALLDALHRALHMPLVEQERRNRPMLDRLQRYNTARWADDFLDQLETTRQRQPGPQPKRLTNRWQEQLLDQYSNSKRRLLLLDYDGTLVPFTGNPQDAIPDEQLLDTLQGLAEVPENAVVVISGRDAKTLENWLGDLDIDLAAEHGGRVRRADDGDWRSTGEITSDEWKDQLQSLMEVYVDRTPGAEIERKGAALVWHYRKAEPELGSLRAKELIETLEGFVANTPLHILQGNKVVEVKQSGVSKGKAAQLWLLENGGYDFVLAMGDDVTDEDLFGVVPRDGWKVKVGLTRHSKADFYLPGSEEVRLLLQRLLDASS
jgi:trehalose 6-phosphate synthase/phosphatase